MSKDYYKILGIDKKADDKAIKNSYRKLAKKYHPDKWSNSSESEKAEADAKFKDVNEAYEVLSDPEKRKQYDMFGVYDPKMNFNTNMGNNDMDIDDYINAMYQSMNGNFGFGRGFNGFHTQEAQQVADKRMVVQVTLNEINTNAHKHYKVKVEDGACPHCNGSGDKRGHQTVCPYCHGTGMISMKQSRGYATMIQSHPCPHCQGRGSWIEESCPQCHGSGKTSVERIIDFNVPNIDRLSQGLRFVGMGGSSNGISADIVVEFEIINDVANGFQLDRQRRCDIWKQISVSVLDCLTGGSVKVKCLDGSIETITLPQGTPNASTMKIAGKGLEYGNSSRGDMYVYITHEMPKDLDKDDIAVLEKIKKKHKKKK